MDDQVLSAMAKWPQVPALSGWLRLDRRGAWLLRGRAVSHANSLRYIAGNYQGDDAGRFFFQNGPQRVFVTLDATPWIYMLAADGQLRTHTGLQVSQLLAALIDEDSQLYLVSEHGVGLVHDGDLAALAEHMEGLNEQLEARTSSTGTPLVLKWQQFNITVEWVSAHSLAGRFGFQKNPQCG